jgi:threonylcarbamoyladenosine tRNA methylthiotransferase MtaB
MRIAFTTLGCKINQYETDLMRRDVLSSGSTLVPFDAEADVYVINTCSVTAKSDYQCRQAIRSAVRRGQGAKVVVTGCYAETRPDEIKKIPGVDLIIGNRDKRRVGQFVNSLVPATCESSCQAPDDVRTLTVPGARTRGFLKIQDGCDNRCSYCIVPSARGGSRSVGPADVLQEFESLVHEGYPEIVLSGIHIGVYGLDLPPRSDLTNLLKMLLAKRGTARVRLSSIEPREITDGIIELLGSGLCRHLHIPLQSGDGSILKAMGRDYSPAFYLNLLRRIADRVPGVALGADVMVGFPGEGEREFRNTFRLIEGSPLTHLHVFSFSPRPGTPAAEMIGQVPETVKKERNEKLRELGNRKNLDFRKKFLGLELEVVLEGKADAVRGCLNGLTDNYIRVTITASSPDYAGRKVKVRIIDVSVNLTRGEVIN